jgi:polyphenol oxidase
MRYRKPTLFSTYQPLIALETTRHGGVSPVPYQSLNLGKNTDDAPEHIAQNRELLCNDLGIAWNQVAYGKQVHGNQVCHAALAGRYDGYDAFITNTPNVAVAVTVADCTPILFYDFINQACGAAHAGWKGASAKIASQTLQAMYNQFGTKPEACIVYVGTSISQAYFEVGSEVAELFDPIYSRKRTKEGKYDLDLKTAIKAELMSAGVPEQQIEVSPFCTWANNDDYFSHRREAGKTGRFMALIGVFEH